MIKKRTWLRSMAAATMLGQGIPRLSHNDHLQALSKIYYHSKTATTLSNVPKSRIFAGLGFNLKGCALDYEGNNIPNVKRTEGYFKGGKGFQGTCVSSLWKLQPILELGLQPKARDRSPASANRPGESVLLHTGNYSTGFPERRHDSLPEKIAVAVDVDEVLGSFVAALNKFIADRYSSVHSISEYHVYEFFKIWDCSRDEADIRVHEFFKTHYFKDCIYPIPGARKALDKLSEYCNLTIVTSRQNVIKDHTVEWVEKHFPGLFNEMHFGNHFALDGESRSKSEICRTMEAKVLIDDNPRYALECAEVGIRVLLFDYQNSYPWCKTDSVDCHPLVTRVHDWDEVEQQLASFIIN